VLGFDDLRDTEIDFVKSSMEIVPSGAGEGEVEGAVIVDFSGGSNNRVELFSSTRVMRCSYFFI